MVTLQQLRYFRELAKTEHLTHTAERLYITQTTLSNTIINLEKQLGVKLFDRTGRTLHLNPVGREYYKYVNEALMALENADAYLADLKEGDRHTISLAMSSSVLWGDLVRGFQTRYREHNLRQVDVDHNRSRRMLLDQELDFVFSGLDDFSAAGLECRILREEKIYLAVPKDHPLAGREGIRLIEAKDESFINLPKSMGFRPFCDEMFRKAGVEEYRTAAECDYTLRGKLVEAGFGVALTTSIARSQNMLGADLAYVPVTDDFARRPIALYWNPRHYLSRAAIDFRNYVIETVK